MLKFALSLLFFLLFFLSFTAQEAPAQIVDLQSEVNKKIEPGFSGALAGSWDRRTGNTDIKTKSMSGLLRYRHHTPETVLFLYSKEDGEKDGDTFIDNKFLHLRYRWNISDFFTWEIFVQKDWDEFSGYQSRDVMGAGPLLKWQDKDDFTFYTGLAYMYEYEKLLTHNDQGERDRNEAERWSLAVLYNQQWLPGVNVNFSAYYQPDVYHKARHRTIINYGWSFDITQAIAYNFTGYSATNTNPAPGVAKVSEQYKHGLKWVF